MNEKLTTPEMEKLDRKTSGRTIQWSLGGLAAAGIITSTVLVGAIMAGADKVENAPYVVDPAHARAFNTAWASIDADRQDGMCALFHEDEEAFLTLVDLADPESVIAPEIWSWGLSTHC